MEPRPTPIRTTALVAALVLLATPLAGCIGFNNGEETTNEPPRAALSVEPRQAWTGTTVVFDASGAEDPDGEVRSYLFDFGDGDTARVDNASDPTVNHTYEAGGVYTVSVTVTDDGAPDGEARSATANAVVIVHERVDIEGTVAALDAPANQTGPRTYTQSVDVGPRAGAFELVLNLSNALPLGQSELTVRVLDPSGAVLADDNVTVGADGNETLTLEGELSSSGEHTVEVTANDGAASFEGVLKVLYQRTTTDGGQAE